MSDSNASDVIIIGRGGGSAEDLCAFNDEEVARAVFNCRTPIISAVGHETDYTICDFTADLRAPTPSAAAELAVPDKSELKNRIDSSISLIYTSVFEKVYTQKNITKLITSSLNTEIPKKLINFRRIVLDEHIKTIMDSEVLSIREKRHNLGSLSGKLDAMSPFKVMARGYSITTNMNGTLINSIDNIDIDDKICIQLLNGKINCVVDGIERLNK
jgi:exodeoxyribonuclease VII large subunit